MRIRRLGFVAGKAENGGAVIDVNNPQNIRQGLKIIAQIVQKENYRAEIREIALRHRGENWQKNVYDRLILGS